MISFSKLGSYGRFGNQLFQYAFLRSQAKRLGVQFYCPQWIGDTLFNLEDYKERSKIMNSSAVYVEDPYQHGFSEKALLVEDGTDVAGYFQSWKFFDRKDVIKWFTFKDDMVMDVREKYRAIDFTKATAIHVRLGDYLQGSLMFYTPTPDYFKKALSKVYQKGNPVLVFSEDVNVVKKFLGEMPSETVFIEGNKDYEDFYIITQCKNIIISPSSFSWWAAYLNEQEEKKVFMPLYWYIPFSRVVNTSLLVNGWTVIKGHRLIKDNYYYRYMVQFLFSRH